MQPRSADRIRNETGGIGLDATDATIKKCEEPAIAAPSDGDMAGSTNGICKPNVAAAKPASIIATKATGHT
jgi:hypothetical protein